MIYFQKTNKKAFSLIEISVVILIIGILIAGISNGIDLYRDMKLTTSRNLTQNSRIGRIENLISWYETTKESNFSKGTSTFEDLKNFTTNQEINRWKDSNPRSIVKYDATQTDSANQPKIIIDDITSLPIVKFDGSPRHFILPNGTVPFNNSAYTIIFVCKNSNNSPGGILGSGTYAPNSSNAFRYETGRKIHNYWYGDAITDETSPANSVALNKFQIFTFTYDQTNRKIYIDGVYQTGDTPPARASTNINNTIGLTCSTCGVSREFLNGAIGELIIFDRGLQNAERQDIEKYLAKKWSIKI